MFAIHLKPRTGTSLKCIEAHSIHALQDNLLLNVLALLGNGFIEGGELDKFLRELISSINLCDYGPEVQTLTSDRHD